MALILNIDMAVELASLCLAKDGDIFSFDKNGNQKDHASWLHPAIEGMMKKTGWQLRQLDAIAITIGPGSYTGLRVGLASAKGLCYALQKPLIALNTLQVMANAVKKNAEEMICPMIDARRMEVFTAIYSNALQTVAEPGAMILDEKSFSEELSRYKILFCGNGCKKFHPLCNNINAAFTDSAFDSSHMIELSEKQYAERIFANLVYTEPLYLKEFHTATPKPLI